MRLKDINMTKRELKDIVNTYMVETYARFDFVAEYAKGMYLYDEKGNRYLDFYGGVAVNNAGNGNRAIIDAIKSQAEDVIHTFNFPYTVPQAVLAKKICETIGMDKIYYVNSGTEANETMIKMARKYGTDKYGKNKYHIITAKKSFHGRTYAALSATGQVGNGIQSGYYPILPGFTYADFNDLESFKRQITPQTIAIMIEPVQGEGGVRPATKEFMTGLRKLCDERGLLLLLDEVQTGWGRCGAPMAYMEYGIKPDIVAMAKAMGGGMPIGAICANKKVAKVFTLGSHGATYGGNALACAASIAAIDEILDNNLPENAKEVGRYLRQELRKLPHVKEVRGMGLLCGIEYDIPISNEVKYGVFDRGGIIVICNEYINRLVPPLIAKRKHVDRIVRMIGEAICEAAEEVAA